MGQKTNPIGFRLGVSKQWRSRWYANRDFPALLKEDELLRKYLKARVGHAAIADIHIERKPGKVVAGPCTRHRRVWSSARKARRSTSCATS